MADEDPIQEIQDRHGHVGLGAIAYRIYEGARADGASRFDAICVTAAWVVGTIKSDEVTKEEDE